MSANKFCEWRVASCQWFFNRNTAALLLNLTLNTQRTFASSLTFLISEVQVESKGFFDVFHFSTAERPDMLNDPRSVYGSDLVGFDF